MTDTPSKSELRLFNSLTREIETFQPLHEGEARVYTCGPTVYNYPHIGNMRAYVFADILGRTLSWEGYKLTHIINITDVGHLTDDADDGEDKMEKMAEEKAQSIWDIARHYTEAYWADVKALNIRQPAKWSVATDYIDEMIEFASSIADKHCYEIDSGLYFDVATIEDYGKLARAVTEEGEGRIERLEGKRNAADFAIWRKTPPGEKRQMEWDSPWGKGAPGWHLECSVMGEKLLGFPFDIHTGGIDHREIHHPNEIAQNQAFCGCGGLSEATNSGAKMWMHNNFLVERSGKMSKSAGEFLRLQLLIDKGYHPLAYRMMCLQAHHTVGERMVALVDQQLQPQEFARGLRHLARTFDEEIVVHPHLRAGIGRFRQAPATAERLVLSDFVGVVDLAVVDPAGVDVERESEQFLAHHRAFEVPAGSAFAPWRIPFHLPLLARRSLAPDREIGSVALAFETLDPTFAFLGHSAG